MCTCASCEYTDSFTFKGFAEWPRGEPAGERSSNAAYAAHVAHAWAGVSRRVPFTPGQAPIYPRAGYAGPVQPNATAIRWNAGRGQRWVAPAEIVKNPSLLDYARQLRQEERERKKALRLQLRRAA